MANQVTTARDGIEGLANLKNVAGVFVPEELINKMAEAEDKTKTGIAIAANIINELRDICYGVHIMAIGWEKKVPAVLDAAGL